MLIKVLGLVSLEAGRNFRPTDKTLQAEYREGNVTLERVRIKSKASDAATGANMYLVAIQKHPTLERRGEVKRSNDNGELNC